MAKVKSNMLSRLRPTEIESDPTAPVEHSSASETPRKRGRPVGSPDPSVNFTINVKASFKSRITETADAHNVPYNQLVKFLLADGLNRLENGTLKLPIRQRTIGEIEMPE